MQFIIDFIKRVPKNSSPFREKYIRGNRRKFLSQNEFVYTISCLTCDALKRLCSSNAKAIQIMKNYIIIKIIGKWCDKTFVSVFNQLLKSIKNALSYYNFKDFSRYLYSGKSYRTGSGEST